MSIVHEIQLDGYCARFSGVGARLQLGTYGSYGVEQLHIELGESWQGLVVYANFITADGTTPVLVPESGLVDVPPEATAKPGTGNIVLDGTSDGVRIYSVDIPYLMLKHSALTGEAPAPTPDRWEQFVAEVKGYADSASESAKQAREAAGAVSGAVEAVESAKTEALSDIGTAKTDAVNAVQDAGSEQTTKVTDQGTAALTAIGQAAQSAIEQVQAAGSTQYNNVNSAGSTQVKAVQDAGTTAVGEVKTAADALKTELESVASHPPQPNTATGKWQVWDAESGAYVDTTADYQGGYYTPSVSDDGELTWQGSQEGMPTLTGTNIKGPKGDPGLGVPEATPVDAGKVPMVKPDGSGYELGKVQTDAYTKAESDARFAPIEAAIRPTASGNPATLENTLKWPMQGLNVYGKSTQVTTTGAQLFDASMALDNTWIIANSGGTEAANGFWTSDYIPVQPGQYFCSAKGSSRTAFYDAEKQFVRYYGYLGGSALTVSEGEAYIRITGLNDFPPESIMLNSGSTASPWEPYTGGQASPSPDYPQEIHSAGENGSIAVTVSDGADQSQQLAISTPTGLPGIPVDSGGNYTDERGQQWVCDEIDFARGVYVQRVRRIELDGSEDESFIRSIVGDLARFSIMISDIKSIRTNNIDGYCSSYIAELNPTKLGVFYFWRNQLFLYPIENFDTPLQFKEYLQDFPVEVYYILDTPIETPLSAEELASYAALHSYDGTTVVATDEDVAGLSARAIVDPAAYIDSKIQSALAPVNQAVLEAKTNV